ncbi:bifunctional ADP-dependent NAD(P)H-hydrate dehydratase/NAD(P)H-hydrate epimerase [Deinococcus arcticus]|uniref:ADP-dependent (S)-NAD(P)H-hydrate dehydratase n=2 Tax=Deinococcus arcticus TaxID=2136176 RepID=A0A2T3WC16_9DEIO|nr:bifunctional ADP-dependent NAD(P)H-hydrate dehydratase/NAD(P)H-hydrate epimerase [Deinococcus arcticus]
MEEAGRAAADELTRAFPGRAALLLAGGGANGGDAFVAARHLLALGAPATVLALPSRHPLTRANRRRWRAVGGQTVALTPAALSRRADASTVLVDGLLGTGFQPPLRPALAGVIAALNAARALGSPVLSLDLPSGLEAELAGADQSVQADVTVTFSGLKPALLFGPAAARAGRVVVAPLRLPPGWALAEAVATQPGDAELGAVLPVRGADAHKGTAGRVWIVGGHPGTAGAPLLAGLGALRAGAGLVTVHSGTELPLLYPELMVRHHANLGAFLAAEDHARPDAVALGMGLGPGAAGHARRVLAWGLPTVLDADALQPELAGHGHAGCLWTPHPGEAARLLGVGTPDITREPLAAARALQTRLGGVVILKGGPSVVADDQGLSVSRGGHPGMASGGMGDTLSGLLAALLAQGLGPGEAARVGVRLHARAGERAARVFGYGLGATDVAHELGGAWADLRVAHPGN